MESGAQGRESGPPEKVVPAEAVWSPPIVSTSVAILNPLQKELKSVSKHNLGFRTIRDGTRVITKDMVDCVAVNALFDKSNLVYFGFYLNFQTPIKAVVRRLPQNTLGEDISDGLVDLGLYVISVVRPSIPC
jgi:hypothetical protein